MVWSHGMSFRAERFLRGLGGMVWKQQGKQIFYFEAQWYSGYE